MSRSTSHSVDSVDTVVNGAGHAGLAVSALLSRAGREHVVLEQAVCCTVPLP